MHLRAGGRIEKVAPTSIVAPGPIVEWRRWTGMSLDTSGRMVVPEALAPIHVFLEQDPAVYVEPNVWVRHIVSG